MSDALRQDLLAFAVYWHQHTSAEGEFASAEVEAEYLHRGRGLQARLQHELDQPVEFSATR